MFNVLRGLVGPAIKYLGPIVAGWGLNKLFESNQSKAILPPQLIPALKSASQGIIARALKMHHQRYGNSQVEPVQQEQEIQNVKLMPNQRRRPIRKRRARRF